jgi:hypothetical protein
VLRWSALVAAVTMVVVVAGGTLVWLAERSARGSNLLHWGDCLWWSVTTLTTVGYGEHYPVTLPGRLVAVTIMFSGVGIIGAVAAVVAFWFASRLTQRLEAAVSQVESQVEHVEAEMESVSERVGAGRGHGPRSGLRELVIGVADRDTAGSLTWLLARLGWHPQAGDHGVSWQDGGLSLRIAVRPWDTPFGVQGRLTFSAGSPDRLARIAGEAVGHGFHPAHARDREGRPAPAGAPLAGPQAAPVPAPAAAPAARPGMSRHAPLPDTPPDAPFDAPPEPEELDGATVVLRTSSGFEVVLVSS